MRPWVAVLGVVVLLLGIVVLERVRPARSAGRNDFARADSAAALADTIIVQPESLVLGPHDSLPTLGLLRTRALDAHGTHLTGFVPLLALQDTRVAQFRANRLVALAPGRTAILVTPLKFGRDARVSRARTAVPLVVAP